MPCRHVAADEDPTSWHYRISIAAFCSAVWRKPRAWEDFVDRFMGLVIHVVNHSAQSRSLRLTDRRSRRSDCQVFLAIVKDDLAVLRNFRGGSSLATYLTVIARRVVVHELVKQKHPAPTWRNGRQRVGRPGRRRALPANTRRPAWSTATNRRTGTASQRSRRGRAAARRARRGRSRDRPHVPSRGQELSGDQLGRRHAGKQRGPARAGAAQDARAASEPGVE